MLPIYIYLLKVEILENHCLLIAQLSVNWQGNVLTLVKVWGYLQINNCHIKASFLYNLDKNYQRCIYYPVERLWWSLFAKIVNGV